MSRRLALDLRVLSTPVALSAAAAVGVLFGLSLFTFAYGEGTSYLSDAPEACANCHVMQAHYDAWLQSSHARVAVCNDCHVPDGFVGKWVSKGDNGFFHTVAFTTGVYPEVIQIKPRNRRITQGACLGCHGGFVHGVDGAGQSDDALLCVRCHTSVGHAGR